MKIQIDEWKNICKGLFTSIGIDDESANIIAEAAVTADVRGVGSHGTVRLSTYRKRIEEGVVNPNPEIKIENDSPGFLRVDGDNGLGQVVAYKALEMAMEKAKEYGSCAVAIHKTNHMGMLSYYALEAAEKNFITNIMCNTPPFVAAIGGAEPALGTNPICWGVPAQDFPIIMDMAISPARGRIKNAFDRGEEIPQGWALDKDGNPTTDAGEGLEGVLLPSGGVKGYGIGVIVEIFSGVLSGANFGKNMPHPLDDYENKADVGTFMMVLDTEKILPIDTFKARVSEYSRMLKASKLSAGSSGIYLPGELEFINSQKIEEEGLEISKELYEEYVKLSNSDR